jgi:undecaprenyl-diphosphatase
MAGERRLQSVARRHPGDPLRLVIAVVLFGLCLDIVRGGVVSPSEADAFRLFNDLPRFVTPFALVLAALGSAAAAGAAVAAAAALRRFRLAGELLVASGLAFGIGFGVQALDLRPGPAALAAAVGHVNRLHLPGWLGGATGFPSVGLAVAAALAASAGPYLTRPARRLAWLAVAGVAGARLYGGHDLPVDMVGGLAIGWAIGAALNLFWGAPTGHPSLAQVRQALSSAGIETRSLELVGIGAGGYVHVIAQEGSDGGAIRVDPEVTAPLGRGRSCSGVLFVKLLGREERSADLLLRAFRWLVFRGVEDQVSFAPRRVQVEHEAFVAQAAARAGVRVPRMVAAGQSRNGAVFVVEEFVPGRTLDELDPSELTAGLLDEVWRAVARLHAARISHQDLRRHSLLLADDGAIVVLDFARSRTVSGPRRQTRDVAELLVSLSLAADPEEVSTSALRVLGRGPVVAALPFVQPLALSSRTMRELRGHVDLIGRLREHISAEVGEEPPPLAQVTRVRPRTVIGLLAFGFAVQLLLPQVGQLQLTLDAVKHGHFLWLVAGVAAAAATYPAAALAQMGAVEQRLRLWETTAVQVACSFTNRVTPAGTGGLGLNERYLEVQGVDRSRAVGAVGLNVLAGAVVHTVGVLVALAVLGRSGIGGVKLPRGWGVLVAVVLAFFVLGVAALRPIRRRLVGPLRRAVTDLWRVVRRPVQSLQLFGGSIGVTLGNALSLAACLAAFGAGADLGRVLVVYLGGSAVASVSPTPGSLGAVEAALVAGLTGVGVATGPAVAGVLAFRLITFWLPTLPGVVAYRTLRRRHVV